MEAGRKLIQSQPGLSAIIYHETAKGIETIEVPLIKRGKESEFLRRG
ncbi:MAG: hypothetical protein QM813_01510 [Verrucomicrobiota bacterium]